VCAHPREGCTARLFCFPHAGGGPHAFRKWSEELPRSIEVHALSPPGRGERMSEPQVSDMETLVAAAVDAIAPHLAQPVRASHAHGIDSDTQLSDGDTTATLATSSTTFTPSFIELTCII